MIQKDLFIEFIRQKLTEPLSYSTRCAQAYSSTIQSLKSQLGDLKRLNIDLNDESLESAAAQFHRFFPTHYYKFYKSLLSAEKYQLERDELPNVIGWPKITIIDIGCGGGAASVAILSILNDLQKFLFDRKVPIQPIQVQLFAIDPSKAMLRIYTDMLNAWGSSTRNNLISVRHIELHGEFPTDFRRLFATHMPEQNHSVLLCMSNVIRPLSDMFSTRKTYWQEMINQTLQGEEATEPILGFAESRAASNLMSSWNLRHIALLGVAVGSDPVSGHQWSQLLNEFLITTGDLLEEEYICQVESQTESAVFRNFPDSFFGYRETYPINPFDWKLWQATRRSFIEQSQLADALNSDNLKLAWMRSKRYSQMETLVDEIEIGLFDQLYKQKIDQLRCQVLQLSLSDLNVEQAFWYQTPKSSSQLRTRAVPRLAEQIISTAIIQAVADIENQEEGSSYSYHLNPAKSEYLYVYWLKLWKRYLQDTQRAAEKGGRVLVTDISGFFRNIDQHQLIDGLKASLITDTHLQEILQYLLLRHCGGEHEEGKGLLQGHIASGFWANFYLSKIDDILQTKFPTVTYARYTDDMVLVIEENDENKLDSVSNELQKLLAVLKLSLSDDKTNHMVGEQYVRDTTDDVIDELQNNFLQPLLKGVLQLNEEYKSIFERNPGVIIKSCGLGKKRKAAYPHRCSNQNGVKKPQGEYADEQRYHN